MLALSFCYYYFGFLFLLCVCVCFELVVRLQLGIYPPPLPLCSCVFYDAFGLVLIFMWESVYLAGFSVGGLLRSVNAVPMCRIYGLNCLFYDCSSFDALRSLSLPLLVSLRCSLSTVCSSSRSNNNNRNNKHFMCTTKCMKCTANSKVPGGGR